MPEDFLGARIRKPRIFWSQLQFLLDPMSIITEYLLCICPCMGIIPGHVGD